MTAESLKLVEILKDGVIQIAGMFLVAYALRLLANIINKHYETRGPLLPPQPSSTPEVGRIVTQQQGAV